jgi:alpha-glucosidase (family GH31 glycosyl hydrolase)
MYFVVYRVSSGTPVKTTPNQPTILSNSTSQTTSWLLLIRYPLIPYFYAQQQYRVLRSTVFT